MLNAQFPGVLEVRARGVAAVKSHPRRHCTVMFDVSFEHWQAACTVRRVAVLHHNIERQPTTSRSQVNLVSLMRPTTPVWRQLSLPVALTH